jgi:tetratricopeptide (TPR) repeat protein
VRQRLRTLSKMNAEDVGRHLIMVGLLLEDDPELAYRHAQVAVARAGRVDVVREAAGLAAYATGRYADALRELRTVRRLSGSSDHLAVEADCERGLGRPERAIALAKSPEGVALEGVALAELQIVVAGARVDLGDFAAALHMLERIKTDSEETAARVAEVKVDVLRALGRVADADALAASLPSWDDDDVEIVVFDAEDDDADDDDAATSGPDEGEPEARGPRDDHSEDREDPAP